MERGPWAKFGVSVVLAIVVLGLFSVPLGAFPALGSLLDPTSGVWTTAPGASFPRDAEARVPGLSAPVTIVRDGFGVPHIYAGSEADGWYALGYAHAQDRLWQMDIEYRAAAGRLAEVLGSQGLESDRFFRTIGLNRIARAAVEARSSAGELDAVALLAYAAGVNAYIRRASPAELPLEFKLLGYTPDLWSEESSITLGALLAFGLAGAFYELEFGLLESALGPAAAEELFPLYPPGTVDPIDPRPLVADARLPAIAPEAARDVLRKVQAVRPFVPRFDSAGSNNWAVAGARTSTGAPLLAADPHLSLQLPSLWYWAELHAGPIHVRGATFAGVPGFFFGTNGRIAWGETNTGADVNDFYIETFNEDRTQVLFRGAWVNITRHAEPIRVRGSGVEPFEVLETGHGPVVTELGQTVAVRSTVSLFETELKAILLVNRAGTWAEFRDALAFWKVPAQNFVYADVGGNIGIRSNGWFPIVNGTLAPRVPLNGSSGNFEWTDWVPFDAYPESFNPPEGFVASANQVPATDRYAYYLGTFWDEGYRARRIHNLLQADANVSLDDMRAFQLDVGDEAAAALVPRILVSAVPRNATDDAVLALLGAWDFRMDANESAPAVWDAFVSAYLEATFGDEYAAADVSDLHFPQFHVLEEMTLRGPAPSWFDDVSTPAVESRADILQRAFEVAVDGLTVEMGPDPGSWTWGVRHVRRIDHLSGLAPLARGPFPSEGDGFTLNVARGLVATSGPSWRQLLDFSDLNASLAVYPGGQSGNPLSPNYDDLLGLYLRGEYAPFRGAWSSADLPAGAVASILRLLPG